MKKILNASMKDIFGNDKEFTNLEMVVFYSTIVLISILTFTA